jgi:hypothetical protein
MNIKWFVREYNKCFEGRATINSARAVFDEQGLNPEDFSNEEFSYLAELYRSRKDFIELPNAKEKTAPILSPKDTDSPFASMWYRCSKCEIRQYDLGSVPKASTKSPFWVFVFSGEVEEYKPSAATLEDALNLTIPDDSFEMPSENIRRFFECWGPLGLYYLLCPPSFSRAATGGPWFAEFLLPFTNVQNGVLLELPKKIEATELWRQFHLTEIQDRYAGRLMISPNRHFFQNYFEYGFMALPELRVLKFAWEQKERGFFHLLNAYLTQGIREVIEVDENGPHRGIEYRSLRDALYGLIALEIDSKRPWQICANEQCRRQFLRRKDPRQKYCSDKCRLQQADRGRRKREKQIQGRADK